MNQECGAARRLAWGKRDLVVTPVGRGRALAHIGQCPDCRRYTSDMESLRTAVGRTARLEPVPAGLMPSVLHRTRIVRARRARVSRWLRTGLVAAVVLVAAKVLWPAGRGLPGEVYRQRAALLAEPGIESSDVHEVQVWLDRRAPFHAHVPSFPDARLTGAAVAVVGSSPTVVIRFQVGNQFMMYAVASADSKISVDSSFRREERKAAATVAWRSGGLDHLWIGTIPVQHLASFAVRCAEQARAAMGSRT